MSSFLSEPQARLLRWLLISGWLALIASLLLPSSPVSGNRLFWGTVVPVVLLLIAAVSHELWRRICPLAFVSQLAQALGRQRTRPGKGNRPELVLIAPGSWLGRHHIELQWSLLIAGLCLRLLGANSQPLWLAVWLTLTLLAAVMAGWAWGGKTWCQYLCPMGPVQTVLTGLRGPLGSTAHVAAPSRLTQSMCRTLTPQGKERSACVACATPCLDIDAERAFWHNLHGKRGLAWAWYSYPGLVLAFGALLVWIGHGSPLAVHPLGYIRSGAWALDRDLAARAWQPLPHLAPLPRLLTIPLLLTALAWASVVFFRAVEALIRRHGGPKGTACSEERSLTRTRLLASFAAINLFFWFIDPSQGLLGPHGGQLVRSLVLLLTTVSLQRGWERDQATWRREGTSDSLRRQLNGFPGLEHALDGRSLEELSPEEVFTLAKALPAAERHHALRVYNDVVNDLLREGRLDQAQALLELAELRAILHLDDGVHHAVIHLLAKEHPELVRKGRLERQSDELRREVAHLSLQDVLQSHGVPVLDTSSLSPAWRERLEALRLASGLSQEDWEEEVARFGPRGELERQRLLPLREAWLEEAALLAWLESRLAADPPLRPLRRSLIRRVEDLLPAGLLRLADQGQVRHHHPALLCWSGAPPATISPFCWRERPACASARRIMWCSGLARRSARLAFSPTSRAPPPCGLARRGVSFSCCRRRPWKSCCVAPTASVAPFWPKWRNVWQTPPASFRFHEGNDEGTAPPPLNAAPPAPLAACSAGSSPRSPA